MPDVLPSEGGRQPTAEDVARAVEGRPAVTPSMLWFELGGEGDFAPLWVFEQLRRLGYGPHPGGFWWAGDLPLDLAKRMQATMDQIDAWYPDGD